MILIAKKNNFFKLDLLILTALKNKDRYGYDLRMIIKEKTNNIFNIKEGVMYTILHKLLEEQYITSYNEIHENRIRVYYHITDSGKKYLAAIINEFKQGVNLVQDFIDGEG